MYEFSIKINNHLIVQPCCPHSLDLQVPALGLSLAMQRLLAVERAGHQRELGVRERQMAALREQLAAQQ